MYAYDESEIITVENTENYKDLWEQMEYQYAAISEVGARSCQQDSLFVGEKGSVLLAVICDGMGGMEGGEKASALAVQMFVEDFYNQEIGDYTAFLKKEAIRIDEAVFQIKENGQRIKAGTTIVAVVVSREGLHWLSVGDSRLYLYRNGEMLCPVVAHNYRLLLDQKLASGEIDMGYYIEEEKRAEALISYLGIGHITRMEINVNPFLLVPGDQILLCSDGLYRSLDDERILKILNEVGSLDEKVQKMLNEAIENGGNSQDNVSIVLLTR